MKKKHEITIEDVPEIINIETPYRNDVTQIKKVSMTQGHKESIHGKYYFDSTSEERLTMAAIITQRFEFLRSHTKSITDMAIPYL